MTPRPMSRSSVLVAGLVVFCLSSTLLFSADRQTFNPPAAAAKPMAGEQIKWQVIAGGGGKGGSTNFILAGTVGQTAAGPGASTNYKVTQGFWQNFSCCKGKRGDLNLSGGIDVSDLSALVSYLTSGVFVPSCKESADVNGSGGIDVSDLSSLVSYLTGGTFVLVNCP
jgi:hypothetical protein